MGSGQVGIKKGEGTAPPALSTRTAMRMVVVPVEKLDKLKNLLIFTLLAQYM